jgi:hypothetical protein
MHKSSYVVRGGTRHWEVIFLPTGRSVGTRYSRKEARELARGLNLQAARCDQKELVDVGRNESLR